MELLQLHQHLSPSTPSVSNGQPSTPPISSLGPAVSLNSPFHQKAYIHSMEPHKETIPLDTIITPPSAQPSAADYGVACLAEGKDGGPLVLRPGRPGGPPRSLGRRGVIFRMRE